MLWIFHYPKTRDVMCLRGSAALEVEDRFVSRPWVYFGAVRCWDGGVYLPAVVTGIFASLLPAPDERGVIPVLYRYRY